ncbi:hypothetical protein P171DRAFT_492103 [Karstenula rhodostoma CBS 690.94]|uniref:Uncharacterized protein n=1 Tax=Karstenula rhodostoma CBS 690.94 TaxID=1392251 RepID=A0A9P4P6F0_9PLEO|nr:hypothetical protein P171DRAFT_492103 [Karstenula rhodostoma CBS 690.94]
MRNIGIHPVTHNRPCDLDPHVRKTTRNMHILVAIADQAEAGEDLRQCIHPHHSQYQIFPACGMTLQDAYTTYEPASSFGCPPGGETRATGCTHRLCGISITTSPCISGLFASESLVLHGPSPRLQPFFLVPYRGVAYVPGSGTAIPTDAPLLWNPT